MIYDMLASYYDALVKDEEASLEWVNWIESGISPCDCLELACGSGEITHMLADRGYKMSALDISAQMVKQAKAKDHEQKINFFVKDMKHLDGLDSYSAILCLCDSFNYLLEDDDVDQFFHEVHDHLNTDGLFFFDTHSIDRLDEFAEEYNETGVFDDGIQCQWSIMSEDDLIYQDFAFYLEDGSIVQEHHIQRAYTPEWLEKHLSAYFTIESVKTDFDQDGICEGEKYFYICRKKEQQ